MTYFLTNFVDDTGFVPQDTITDRAFRDWLKALYATGLAQEPVLFDRKVKQLRTEDELDGAALRQALQAYVLQCPGVILENIDDVPDLWDAVRPASSHATVAASGVRQVVKRLLLCRPFQSATATTAAAAAASVMCRYHCSCCCRRCCCCCYHCSTTPVAIMLVTSAGGSPMARGQEPC